MLVIFRLKAVHTVPCYLPQMDVTYSNVPFIIISSPVIVFFPLDGVDLVVDLHDILVKDLLFGLLIDATD